MGGPVVSDVPDQLPRSRVHAARPGRRGDHSTIFRWIQAYSDELEKRIRRHLRVSNGSWQVDETYAQAVALDAIFNEMARRAALNMGEYINATEVYLRLGPKAQAQCRATLQTLFEMKNPQPIAFVKQANIANGPQQVNNGGRAADPSSRAENSCQTIERTIGTEP
jgi:hypothetical protein